MRPAAVDQGALDFRPENKMPPRAGGGDAPSQPHVPGLHYFAAHARLGPGAHGGGQKSLAPRHRQTQIRNHRLGAKAESAPVVADLPDGRTRMIESRRIVCLANSSNAD